MSSLFEDLREGLQEAIDYEKGFGKAKRTVSKKTVEAWELGRTHPTGPACRLLDILDQGKENELSFVSVNTN